MGRCGSNSQLNIGNGGSNSQINIGSDGNSQLNIGSDDGVNSRVDPPKRGRGWMSRTKQKVPPRSGRVEIEPKGHSQFKYVGYNPKGYKYPSQIGTILKREYPGIIKIYDENGTVVKKYPAFCRNDYYWKKDRFGICYAQRVKQEFWTLFTAHPRHRARAHKNLENYLVRRVTNMMYQVRLDAVKIFYHKRNEECDDTRARTIELTEEQYLTSRVEWCNKAVWDFLSKYWNSEEYKKKRLRAQESHLNSEDPVKNRGGSRNFAETQQFLEYNFGIEKSGTLNTYAVMKSGIKNVDSTGRSGPIPSHKAQKRLDDYKALAPDENTQELDGKALYTIGHGMKHGRVPIGDGAVDKAAVLVHAKSVTIKPTHNDDYQSVLKENEQLKETNQVLIEENCVNRELIMRMYADFQKEPPADLLRRLENIDARRHQSNGSPHEDDMENNDGTDDGSNADDGGYHEGDCDDGYHDNNDDACLEGEDDDNGYLEDDLNDLEGRHVGSKEMTTDGSGTRA